MEKHLLKRKARIRVYPLLFTLLSILWTSVTNAQVSTVIIPVNNDNDYWQNLPYGCSDAYQRIQALYYESEIGVVGNITTIGFYVNGLNAPAASTPIVIKLRNTTKNSIEVDNYDAASANAITVYTGNLLASQLSSNNWINIPLTVPFVYAGHNVEVFVETNLGFSGENWDSKKFRWSNTGVPTSQAWYGWNAPPGPHDYGYVESMRPNVRFLFGPGTPMSYDTTLVRQVFTSTYAGAEKQEVLSIHVNTIGQLNALNATRFNFDITGSSTNLGLISNPRIFYTGINNEFDTTQLFGGLTQNINGTFTINGNQALLAGTNYFWLTYDVSSGAITSDSIDAELLDLTIGGTNHTNIAGNPGGNIKVGRQISFESGGAEGFIGQSNNPSPNQWELGVPQRGPSSASHGVNCWATGLNQSLQNDRDFSLYSSSFVVVDKHVSIRFDEWYDFLNTYNDLYASVEYSVNNTGWNLLLEHEPYVKHNTNNKWETFYYELGVNIGDTIRFRWNVTTWTWMTPADGWYIDNIVIAGARPFDQQYVTSNVNQLGGIALPNKKKLPVVNVVIETIGTENPLDVTALDLGIVGSAIVDSVHVYYTGASRDFSTENLYASVGSLSNLHVSGSQMLDEGINHFWVVYDIGNNAVEEDTVDASCTNIYFGANMQVPFETDPDGNIAVGTVIDFDGPSDHVFTSFSNNDAPSEWEQGAPSYGPSAANSGNNCWGTNLSGNYSLMSDYYLMTPPYRVTKSDVYIQYSQWYDFVNQWSDVYGYFEYRVNNGSWQYLSAIDAYTSSTSNNQWQEVLSSLNYLNPGDVIQFRWLFQTSQWSSTGPGWYIDDVVISGLELFDQTYVGSEVQSLKEIAYPGKHTQPVVRLMVEVAGSLNPLHVLSLDVNTNGSILSPIIDSVKVFFSGGSDIFSDAKQYGQTAYNISGFVTLSDSAEMENGPNYFWLVYDVSSSANIGDSLDGEFTQIQFALTNEIPAVTAPSGNVKVARLFDFETTGSDQFLSKVLAGRASDAWAKGTPSTGPQGAFEGTECWGTNLAGLVYSNTQLELKTPPFLATDVEVETNFSQWFDYVYNWSDIFLSFQYQINGTGWVEIYSPNNSGHYNTNYKWQTVYNSISTNINDTVEFRWLYTTGQWSPESEGWFIDNFAISNVKYFDQYIKYTNVHAIWDVATPNKPNQKVAQIIVDCYGVENPLEVNEFKLNTVSTLTSIMDSVRVFYTGSSYDFNTDNQFGNSEANISTPFSIFGNQTLNNGENYFWVSYELNNNAVYGDTLDIECTEIMISTQSFIPDETNPYGVVPVGKLYDFDTVSTENFYVESYGNTVAEWVHGPVSNGPGAAYSGTNCWSTTLNGSFSRGVEYALLSPTYVASSNDIYISYQQWFDFVYTYNDVNASFEINVNNTGWNAIDFIDNYSYGNSGYEWQNKFYGYTVNSADTIQFRWKFMTTTWGNSGDGWFIDNFIISGLVEFDQYYKESYAEQMYAGAYAGANNAQVLKVVVDAAGSLNKLDLNTLHFNNTTVTAGILNEAKVYYTVSNKFDTLTQFGQTLSAPTGYFSFNDTLTLASGPNYFWLVYSVDAQANIGDSLDAEFTGLEIGQNLYQPTDGNPDGVVPIGKLYNFDGTSNEDYISTTLNGGVNDWQRGMPTHVSGPSSAFSGANCWGTGLQQDFTRDNQPVLLSPYYVATHENVYVGFMEFLEYYYSTWGSEAVLEYEINNSGWNMARAIDLQTYYSTFGKWEKSDVFVMANIGDTIQFRWRLWNNEWDNAAGWFIDNLVISGATSIDLYGPEITYTKLTNTNLVTNRVLVDFASMDDISGINTTVGYAPRLYFKKSSDDDVFGINNSAVSGWKFVESTDVQSPFGFTIDYSLLSSTLNIGDTIMYFVVAQDNSVNGNLGFSPSEDASGYDINSLTTAPSNANFFIITDAPLAGSYNVGVGEVYTTLSQAVNDLNTRGVSAAVTFMLTNSSSTPYNLANGEVFPITIYAVAGASSQNTITIKPAAGNNAVLASNNASLKLQGAKFIIIDGSNNGTSSRNLTINANGSTGGIWMCANSATEAVEYCVIKNCNIIGDNFSTKFGIYHGSKDFTSVNAIALAPGSNNTFTNNNINRVLYGIYSIGTSLAKRNAYNTFKNNVIGDALNKVVVAGISLDFSSNDSIIGNTIQNIQFNQVNNWLNVGGITLTNTERAFVSSNKIFNYGATLGGTSFLAGIYINGGQPGWNSPVVPTNNVVFNNFVSKGYSTSSDNYNLDGIIIEDGAQDKVYHNTVNLSGNLMTNGGEVSALKVGYYNMYDLDVRNNIFYINATSTNNIRIFVNSSYFSYANGNNVSDANLYYVNFSGTGEGYIGNYDWYQLPTLSDWVLATGQDANSTSAPVSFVSDIDLHLAGSSLGDSLNLGCLPIPGFNTDIDGNVRNTFVTYKGAHEASPALPVELLSFEATADSDDAIIKWSTASEVNNKGFILERSFNNEQFEEVVFVNGRNKKSISNYAFIDRDVLSSNSVVYYRLQQQDYDGTVSYSKVVAVRVNKTSQKGLTVYPNPFNNTVHVNVSGMANQMVKVVIQDVMDRVVAEKTQQLLQDNEQILMGDLSALQAGVYFITVKGNQTKQVQKLIKQ